MPSSQSVKRNVGSPTKSITSITGTQQAVEGMLVGASSGLGIGGRYLSGGTTTGKRTITDYDGVILLGDKSFRLEVGYAQRTSQPLDTALTFYRGGFNGTMHFGTTGFATRFRASYGVPTKRFPQSGQGPELWEGETGISYTWDRFPLFAQLGYRATRLKAKGYDEEQSALVLGAGVWFWSK